MPEIPPVALYIWNCFLELNNDRSSGMNGPMKITLRQLTDYEEFYGIQFSLIEVSLIRALDAAWFEAARSLE